MRNGPQRLETPGFSNDFASKGSQGKQVYISGVMLLLVSLPGLHYTWGPERVLANPGRYSLCWCPTITSCDRYWDFKSYAAVMQIKASDASGGVGRRGRIVGRHVEKRERMGKGTRVGHWNNSHESARCRQEISRHEVCEGYSSLVQETALRGCPCTCI